MKHWQSRPAHALEIQASFDERCAEPPNDPKLSDRGARRGGCMVGGKAGVEARSGFAGWRPKKEAESLTGVSNRKWSSADFQGLQPMFSDSQLYPSVVRHS